MDQTKIGKFIAQCRKEQGCTQAKLAEKLGITDRAVSKWETGRSMPDASIIPELCALLGVSINELFTGERLNMDQYRQMAEDHLLSMRKQEEAANRKLLELETVIGYMSSVSFMIMIFAASFAVSDLRWRVVLIAAGTILFIVGVACCLMLERDAGYYECPECGSCYRPSLKAVVFAPHLGRSRKLCCPNCGKRGYHKKVLIKRG